MKRHRLHFFGLYLLAGAFALLLGACTKTTTEDPVLSAEAQQFAADKEFIGSLGFDTSSLIRRDTCYIVEGDICLPDKYLEDIRHYSQTRHSFASINKFTIREEYRTIKVKLSDNSTQKKVELEALKYWNEEIRCGLYFIEEPWSPDITIDYRSASIVSGSPETATLPTIDGKPGSKITVYTNTNAFVFGDPDQWKYLLVHALAHTVGFGHIAKNSEEFNTPRYYHISGTATVDPSSIMGAPNLTKLDWKGANDNDKAAFRKVYPYKEPQFIVQITPYDKEYVCNKTYTFKAEYRGDLACPNPAFGFTVTSQGAEEAHYNAYGSTMTIRFPAHGTYTIKVAVTNKTPVVEKTIVVMIYDKSPLLSVTPDGPFEANKTYRFDLAYDNPDAGVNPVYNFLVTNTQAGGSARVSRINNHVADIVFPAPGAYRVKAVHPTNSKIFAEKQIVIEDHEVSLSYPGETIYTSTMVTFEARYYSAAYPNNKFKFEVFAQDGSPANVGTGMVEDTRFHVSFHDPGQYTVRASVVGAPELSKEITVDVLRYIPKIEITHLPKPLLISQRVGFKVLVPFLVRGEDDPQAKIVIRDMTTSEVVPYIYDEGICQCYFFTKAATFYEIAVYYPGEETAAASEVLRVREGGVYTKIVVTDGPHYSNTEGLYWLNENVYFFSDPACTVPAPLPCEVDFRLHLIKKAVELFPGSMSIYRDETFLLPKGSMDLRRSRMTTVHDTVNNLHDYYEIEIVKYHF